MIGPVFRFILASATATGVIVSQCNSWGRLGTADHLHPFIMMFISYTWGVKRIEKKKWRVTRGLNRI